MQELELKSIKEKKRFDEFIKSAERFYVSDAAIFVTYVNPKDRAGKNILEYAVSVRKKQARKAVVRNRIKRLLRECLRQKIKDEFWANKLSRFDKILIVWANAPQHPGLISLQQVCPVVEKLIDKATKLNENRRRNK